MKTLCSQCNTWIETPKHTGRILTTKVGPLSYELCSDECLINYYHEVLHALLGRELP
jgi:hypothetical protein